MEDVEQALELKGRAPVVAGMFYPDERASLEARFCAFGLEPGKGGRAAALIAPHGSWDLSGAVAASAFAAAAGRARADPDKVIRVVILGTIHNSSQEGIYLSDSDFFETTIGKIPVDRELEESLASCSTLFQINDIPHLGESSIEVLLPFIQFCFPEASIVPILMGSAQPQYISALARGLNYIFEPIMDSTLLVVSANLSLNDHEWDAITRAGHCIQLLEEKKKEEFLSGLYDGRISACGGALIGALLESGLGDAKTARFVSGALVKARAERGRTTCYGALAFE
jgi:AmmeMemoRadiSam system protein B